MKLFFFAAVLAFITLGLAAQTITIDAKALLLLKRNNASGSLHDRFKGIKIETTFSNIDAETLREVLAGNKELLSALLANLSAANSGGAGVLGRGGGSGSGQGLGDGLTRFGGGPRAPSETGLAYAGPGAVPGGAPATPGTSPSVPGYVAPPASLADLKIKVKAAFGYLYKLLAKTPVDLKRVLEEIKQLDAALQ